MDKKYFAVFFEINDVACNAKLAYSVARQEFKLTGRIRIEIGDNELVCIYCRRKYG